MRNACFSIPLMLSFAVLQALSASSFNSLISMHAKKHDPKRAESVFSLMQQSGVEPSLITFNALASAHAACGDLAAVERCLGVATSRGLQLDRFSYGALLQACARHPSKGSVKKSAHKHVLSLLHSGVPLNDFLTGACTRAVGQKAFEELRRQVLKPQPSQARGREVEDVGMEEQGGDEAWTTVSSSKQARGRRQTRASTRATSAQQGSPSTPASAKLRRGREPGSQVSAIQKKSSPAVKQPSNEVMRDVNRALSPDARIAIKGVTMTRSKSARARLLSLAQEALPEDFDFGPGAGVPLVRSAASDLQLSLKDVKTTPTRASATRNLPLKRSAGSELALALGHSVLM